MEPAPDPFGHLIRHCTEHPVRHPLRPGQPVPPEVKAARQRQANLLANAKRLAEKRSEYGITITKEESMVYFVTMGRKHIKCVSGDQVHQAVWDFINQKEKRK